MLEEDGTQRHYGYGWTISVARCGQRGGIGGNSILSAFTDGNLLVIILGNRIVYRDLLGIPWHVELPADETSGALAASIFGDDFSTLPRPTLKFAAASENPAFLSPPDRPTLSAYLTDAT